MLNAEAACPCGRTGTGSAHSSARKNSSFALSYQHCCARWHALTAPDGPDPESLMRSRYCAFVLELEAYLLASWHPDTRPSSIEFDAGCRWLGLEVLRSSPAEVDGAETATGLSPADAQRWIVEFVARYKVGGSPAVRIHECSEFTRDPAYGERWRYLRAI